MMDSLKSNDEITVSQVVIYATLSCLVVSFIFVLLYLTCSKRYKLNWFENNLLETAKENEENAQRCYCNQLACFVANSILFIAMKCWSIVGCLITMRVPLLEALDR